uniref:Guanine nucleotide-binding protein subunit gamma n=70 Tax=Passeriformes TaxID=9126 RepID=H0ZJ41_TAEGU
DGGSARARAGEGAGRGAQRRAGRGFRAGLSAARRSALVSWESLGSSTRHPGGPAGCCGQATAGVSRLSAGVCVGLRSAAAGSILLRRARPEPRKNKMKELVSNSTTSISQARKAVEQLKMEAYMDRIKVSKAAADLLAYCDAHIGEDPLIIPVPASENPFREKKLFCTIL